MTDPIAAKAEALWAKRPELRPIGLKYNHLGWWMYHYSVMDDDAHMLIFEIIGPCVIITMMTTVIRLLPLERPPRNPR